MANTRQIADLRTNFSVSGVDSVVRATERVASASRVAYEKASGAAATASARLAAAARASNDSIYKFGKAAADRLATQAKGSDPVANITAARRSAAMAAGVRASRDLLKQTAKQQVSEATAAHSTSIDSAIKKANESLAKGVDSSIVAAQLKAFTSAQDDALALTIKTTDSILEQVKAEDALTYAGIKAAGQTRATAILEKKASDERAKADKAAEKEAKKREAIEKAAAKAAEQAAARHKALALAILGTPAGGLRTVATLYRGIAASVKGATSLVVKFGSAGVKALGAIAKAAKTAATAIGRITAKMISFPASLIARSVTGAFKGLLHVLGSVLEKLKHIVKTGALAGAALYTAADAATKKFAVSATNETAERAKEIGNEAIVAGVSAERYQSYGSAARMLGIDDKDLVKSFQHLSDVTIEAAKSYDAATGTYKSEQGQILQSLGVSLYRKDDNGRARIRSADDMMQEISQKQLNVSGPMRDYMFAQLFGGREALKLQPFFNAYGQDPNLLLKADDRARKMGTMLSKDDLERMRQYRQASNDTQDAWTGIKTQIALAVSPKLTQVLGVVSEFLIKYRENIVHFVSERVVGFVRAMGLLAYIVEYNTGAFLKLIDVSKNYVDQSVPMVLNAYAFYINTIKPIFKALGHGIHYVVGATHALMNIMHGGAAGNQFGWMDRLHMRIHSLLGSMHQLKQNLGAVVSGRGENVVDSRGFDKAVEVRNKIVAYIKLSVEEIRGVLKDGSSDDEFETWAGRMANRIAWLCEQLPTWWEKLKTTVQAGIDLVKSLWSEFGKVLGAGPDNRGTSDLFPWLGTLVGYYDAIREKVQNAVAWTKEFYGAVQSIIKPIADLFGISPEKLVFFVALGRMTGILGGMLTVVGSIGRAFGVWGTVLKGVLAVLGIAGIVGAVRKLAGKSAGEEVGSDDAGDGAASPEAGEKYSGVAPYIVDGAETFGTMYLGKKIFDGVKGMLPGGAQAAGEAEGIAAKTAEKAITSPGLLSNVARTAAGLVPRFGAGGLLVASGVALTGEAVIAHDHLSGNFDARQEREMKHTAAINDAKELAFAKKHAIQRAADAARDEDGTVNDRAFRENYRNDPVVQAMNSRTVNLNLNIGGQTYKATTTPGEADRLSTNDQVTTGPAPWNTQ